MLLALLLIAVTSAASPSPIRASYYGKTIATLYGEIETTVINVEFDEDIFLPYGPSSLRNISELSSIELFNDARSRYLNRSTAFPFDLACSGISFMTNASIAAITTMQLPPSPFLYFNEGEEISDIIAAITGVFQGTLRVASGGGARTIKLVLFEKARAYATNETFAFSKLSNVASKLSTEVCALIFRPFAADRNGQVASETQFLYSHQIMAQQSRQNCDTFEIGNIEKSFASILEGMKGADTPELFYRFRDKLYTLINKDVWSACLSIIKRAVGISEMSVPLMSTLCDVPKNSLDYAIDPCCNLTLAASKCCAPRNAIKKVRKISSIDTGYLARTCEADLKYMKRTYSAMKTYVASLNDVQDPNRGCTANTVKRAGTASVDARSIWNKLSEFIDICQVKVMGSLEWSSRDLSSGTQGQSCQSNSDCYTYCLKTGGATGYCVIPWNDVTTYLSRCFLKEMDRDLKKSLFRLWSINLDAEFTPKLVQFASKSRCIGTTAFKYNGGWYKNSTPVEIPPQYVPGRQYNVSVYDRIGLDWSPCLERDPISGGCFYLPPSQEGCLSNKVCNWQSSLENCSRDLLRNNGSFCAKCVGDVSCVDVSTLAGCALADPNFGMYARLSGLTRNQVCEAQGGFIYQSAESSAEFCYVNELSNSTCNADCLNGPKPAWSGLCIAESFDEGACLDLNTNSSFAGISFAMDNGFVSRCVAYDSRSFGCSPILEEMGFRFEVTESLSNAPAACTNSICYNHTLTESECVIKGGVWDPQLNAGIGSCTLTISFPMTQVETTWQWFIDQCSNAGFTPYVGKRWLEGNFDTAEKCQEGVCNLDGNLPSAECETTARCNRNCLSCRARTSSSSQICRHRNVTRYNEDRHNPMFGRSIVVIGEDYVYYGSSFSQCRTYSEANITRCSDLSFDSCINHPYTSVMTCQQDQRCKTQQQCNNAGECDDNELAQLNWPEVCVYPPSIDMTYGFAFCQTGVPGRAGCMTRDNSVTCKSNGGEILRQSTNRQACHALEMCCELGDNCYKPLGFSSKNETECAKCGGLSKAVYRWIDGTWTAGKRIPFEWKKRQVNSENNWQSQVDISRFRTVVAPAIADVLSSIYQADYQCRYGMLLQAMKAIACGCGVNADPECYAEGEVAGRIGTLDISCNQASTVYASGATLSLNGTYLPCGQVASVTLTRTATGPLFTSTGDATTKRRRQLLGTETRLDLQESCFAVVKNANDVTVGQLRGDCVNLRTTLTMQSSSICLDIDSSIPYNQPLFPLRGIASYSVTEKKYSVMNSIIPTVDATGGETKKLVIAKQPPSKVAAGRIISPFIQVKVLGEYGNLDTESKAVIHIKVLFGSGSPNAVLSGLTKVQVVYGIATFTDLAINVAGEDYVLVVSCGNLPIARTHAFTVVPDVPTNLAFSQQPGGVVVNSNMLQGPIVYVADAYGNRVASSKYQITLSAFHNSEDGLSEIPLLGDRTQTVSRGSASFMDIYFTFTINSVFLRATSNGLRPASSVTFNIVEPIGYPVKLHFLANPNGGQYNMPWIQQPIVITRDANNNDISAAAGSVFLKVDYAQGNGDAQLKGNSISSLVAGSASFTGLSLNRAGSSFSLIASADGLVSAVSTEFAISGPYALVFYQQPNQVNISEPFSVVIQVYDTTNTLWRVTTSPITLSIKLFTGSVGAVLHGTRTIVPYDATAIFSDLSIDAAGQAYVLVATTSEGVVGESRPFSVINNNLRDTISRQEGGGIIQSGMWTPLLVGAASGGVAMIVTMLILAVMYLKFRLEDAKYKDDNEDAKPINEEDKTAAAEEKQ